MTALSVIRLISFVTTIVFSLIVLGVAAHLINFTVELTGLYFPFSALGVASSVLTLVSLIVSLVVDKLRNGAFTSMIVVELCWLCLLWVLWLATGADTANVNSFLFSNSCSLFSGIDATACNEVQIVEAFAFLNWIILLGYSILLLVYAINATSNSRPAWTISAKEMTWSGDSVHTDKSAIPPAHALTAIPTAYPPSSPYSPSTFQRPPSQGGFPASHGANYYPAQI